MNHSFHLTCKKKKIIQTKVEQPDVWDLRLSVRLHLAGCWMPTQLLYVSFSVALCRKKDRKSHQLGKTGRSLNYHHEQKMLEVGKFNLSPVKTELDTELNCEMQRPLPSVLEPAMPSPV